MSELSDDVILKVPFRFKGKHACSTIVAAPISFNFISSLLDAVEVSLGIEAFDLLVVPGFTNKFLRESKTVLGTLDLAHSKHSIKRVVLCQHVDFHAKGKSNRFVSEMEEDMYHKRGLISSCNKIHGLYPKVAVVMLYARLVNDRKEIEIVQVSEDSRERVRLVAPYTFGDMDQCEATAVLCLDWRFRRETRKCVKEALGNPAFNMIGIPGSAKKFLEGAKTAWKGIKNACEKGGCKKIIVFQHTDCGAYGGSASFKSAVEEELFQYDQLNTFEGMIHKEYPYVAVEKIYARLIENNTRIQFVRV